MTVQLPTIVVAYIYLHWLLTNMATPPLLWLYRQPHHYCDFTGNPIITVTLQATPPLLWLYRQPHLYCDFTGKTTITVTLPATPPLPRLCRQPHYYCDFTGNPTITVISPATAQLLWLHPQTHHYCDLFIAIFTSVTTKTHKCIFSVKFLFTNSYQTCLCCVLC